MDRFLIKLNRFSAWALLVLVILYIISGYGIIKGIIDPVFSKKLHEEVLVIPFFIFFVFHVCISSSYALRRWKVFKGQRGAHIYSLIVGLILLSLFFWLYLL